MKPLALLLLLAAPLSTLAQERVLPPDGWTSIEGGEDTGCAFDTPYSFFYREGVDPGRLLIYFQGGGACWNGVSCSGMFDTSVERDELADYRGIFDRSNTANPFQDHAVLFLPYCTGDVHVGDATQTYGDDARPVHHIGARNVAAALDWAEAHLDRPGQVVIAGASAGSYGAIFHAPGIAARYPAADLVTIGDSGVPLLHEYPAILERWGAGSTLRPSWGLEAHEPMTLEQAYREAAEAPGMRAVVSITSDGDGIQSAFYLISGSPSGRDASYALLDEVERATPTIHSFIVAGADHGLMRTDAFYTYEADTTLLAAWIQRLLAGEPVESVRCCAP